MSTGPPLLRLVPTAWLPFYFIIIIAGGHEERGTKRLIEINKKVTLQCAVIAIYKLPGYNQLHVLSGENDNVDDDDDDDARAGRPSMWCGLNDDDDGPRAAVAAATLPPPSWWRIKLRLVLLQPITKELEYRCTKT